MLEGISIKMIPAFINCVPTLIWFVLMPKSVVMVLVRALPILTRSMFRAKNPRPRSGSTMKSILGGVSGHQLYANSQKAD